MKAMTVAATSGAQAVCLPSGAVSCSPVTRMAALKTRSFLPEGTEQEGIAGFPVKKTMMR